MLSPTYLSRPYNLHYGLGKDLTTLHLIVAILFAAAISAPYFATTSVDRPGAAAALDRGNALGVCISGRHQQSCSRQHAFHYTNPS